MHFLRGCFFYVCLSATIICLALGTFLAYPFTKPLQRYEMVCRPWSKAALWLLRVICGVHLDMKGMENMPSKDAQVVVLAKHQSAWDPFWLGAYLTNPPCFLYKKSINWIPVLGWVVAMMDWLAIDRSKGRSAFENFMRKGPEKLKQGWWITLFPEGTRVPPGERVHYKTGGARFACATGTPILPVCHNAGYCWPKNSVAKCPGTVTVSVGPLIQTAGRDPAVVMQEVEEWIENELDKLPHGPEKSV